MATSNFKMKIRGFLDETFRIGTVQIVSVCTVEKKTTGNVNMCS